MKLHEVHWDQNLNALLYGEFMVRGAHPPPMGGPRKLNADAMLPITSFQESPKLKSPILKAMPDTAYS